MTKKTNAEEAKKLAELLTAADGHPMMKVILAEKAAAIRATRTEAAGKIEAVKKEQGEVIPKLVEDKAAKEERFKTAKAALDTAGREFNAAHMALSSRSQSFGHAISGQEQILIESADPAIDEAITFFREKLDWLRESGRISRNAIGADRNVITETKIVRQESNYDAINSTLQYCQAAIAELGRMKLTPVLDVEKIERMKDAIPSIDVFTEYSAEKPYGSTAPYIVPRFGGAASDEYEQTLLDRVIKKANDLISKPAKKRGATGAEATLETYKRGK